MHIFGISELFTVKIDLCKSVYAFKYEISRISLGKLGRIEYCRIRPVVNALQKFCGGNVKSSQWKF